MQRRSDNELKKFASHIRLSRRQYGSVARMWRTLLPARRAPREQTDLYIEGFIVIPLPKRKGE